RGDVALSVAMTSLSTLLAPFVTPLLVLALVGQDLQVSLSQMFLSILQMVLVPVVAGLLLRTFADRWVTPVLPVLPLVSVTGIVLVVTGIVGANADAVLTTGLVVALAVIVHNTLGLVLGHLVGRIGQLPEAGRRSVSIEVGMQNSGLAAALAHAHFAPLAALPRALFSARHNPSGAAVANYRDRRAHHGHPHRDQEQITGGRTVGTGHDLPHHRRHRLHVQRVAARGGRTRGVDPGPVQPVADRGRHP